MMKRFLLSAFVLGACFYAGAQTEKLGERISLDDNWKFHFGSASDPSKDFNYSTVTIFSKTGGARGTAIDPRFNDAEWRTLNVPHDWAVELPFVNSPSPDVMSHGYKPVGGLFPET